MEMLPRFLLMPCEAVSEKSLNFETLPKPACWAIINQGQSISNIFKNRSNRICRPPLRQFWFETGVPLALGLTKGPVDPLPALSLF
jgi:hypothetical protein